MLRQSKGFQNNKARELFGDLTDVDFSKEKKRGIVFLMVTLLAFALGIIFLKWWGILVGVLVGATLGYLFLKPISAQQKKIIAAYKSYGISKEEYIDSFDKISGPAKSLMVKLWDKVPEPEKVISQKGRPQKVGQSKQNKKKRKYKKK